MIILIILPTRQRCICILMNIVEIGTCDQDSISLAYKRSFNFRKLNAIIKIAILQECKEEQAAITYL